MRKHQWVPRHRHTNPLDGGALPREAVPIVEEDGCAPCPSDFPLQPPPAPVYFYAGSGHFDSDGYFSGGGSGITTPNNPNSTTSTTNTDYPIFAAGTTYNYTVTIVMQGGDNPPQWGLADNLGNWKLPHISGVGTGTQTWTGSFDPATFGPVTSYLAYMTANVGALGHTPKDTTITWNINPEDWIDGSIAVAPSPGQWVGISPPETVTMSGADGTTVWPFADGSLIVMHDGTDQTLNIDSYDGAAGTFTLDYTPGVGATITVRYQGRQ